MSDTGDVTQLLQRASAHEPGAVDDLFGAVYTELRRLADMRLARERLDHTLQATELVHEAYLRLVDITRVQWNDRAHFLAVASRAMRRILVDHARRRGTAKRGGPRARTFSLDDVTTLAADEPDTMIVDFDRALEKLGAKEPEHARIVEMRVFGGLTREECAEVLGISTRTVARHWEYAQTWLYRELQTHPAGD